jgi:hypothetical protein
VAVVKWAIGENVMGEIRIRLKGIGLNKFQQQL